MSLVTQENATRLPLEGELTSRNVSNFRPIDVYHGIVALLKFDQTQINCTPGVVICCCIFVLAKLRGVTYVVTLYFHVKTRYETFCSGREEKSINFSDSKSK